MCTLRVRKVLAKVRCYARCCSFIMQTSCIWELNKAKERSTNSILKTPILLYCMKLSVKLEPTQSLRSAIKVVRLSALLMPHTIKTGLLAKVVRCWANGQKSGRIFRRTAWLTSANVLIVTNIIEISSLATYTTEATNSQNMLWLKVQTTRTFRAVFRMCFLTASWMPNSWRKPLSNQWPTAIRKMQ